MNGLTRYAGELTRALIATAPPACDVELILSRRGRGELAELAAQFPGATRTTVAKLSHAALATAWANGVSVAAGTGILHAPSLFAPLVHTDRSAARQIVVTVHDTLAWTHPASLGHSSAAWARRMAHRAAKHADAVVVPSHAVAAELAERVDLGERVRVIPGATSPGIVLPDDPEVRASWLRLPERFVLAAGSMDPRTGVGELIQAAALPDFHELPLLIVGADEWRGHRITETAMLAGLPEGRVRPLGAVSDSDLALLLSRAEAFVAPSYAEGFGLMALEALAFGTPLVHSDAPALVELASGAGCQVVRHDAGSSYAERLAAAVDALIVGDADRSSLAVLGRDRAKAFSWRDSGSRVWQLHAEL
ncbi:glycosyltransferase family 1 protein [Gryllotalpicola protaetiae]|uniref:Glycosyltransferase family 1 protein n=2 Tax=Gryllotalpicola protaetiae TaxID=2419771 RepID=A0A387BX42_9MICO|nr:glycosyltransferase family 1 protein [Gryllotalpicola protaetiae]